MRVTPIPLTAAAVAVLVLVSGCGDGAGSANPGTSFYGTYTDQAGHAGTIELASLRVLPSFGSVLGQNQGATLDGELRIGGQPEIPMTGVFDEASGTIGFVSEDRAFNFNGTVAEGKGSGFGFGPSGPATFVIFEGAAPTSVDVYCGTATCTEPPGCEAKGSFNLVVDGAEALMSVNVDGAVGVGSGTATGSGVSFQLAEAQVDLRVQGEISGSTVSGTWTDETKNVSGTWSGSSSQCRAASG